jgi:hypothetical protein
VVFSLRLLQLIQGVERLVISDQLNIASEHAQPFFKTMSHLRERSPLHIVHPVVGLTGLKSGVKLGRAKSIALLKLSQVSLHLVQLVAVFRGFMSQHFIQCAIHQWRLYYKSDRGGSFQNGSVSTWGQSRVLNLNVSGALYPLESSVYAGFPAKGLDSGTWKQSPTRNALSKQ